MSFDPVGDAQVQDAYPTKNYGSLTTMRVRNGSSIARSFLKFNVTGLSGQPTDVRLRVFVAEGSTDGGGIHAVANAWTESTIAWDTAPAISGAPLASAGAVAAGVWVEFNLGNNAVTADGVYSFGIASGSTNSVYYATRESTNPPQLIVSSGGLSAPVADFQGAPLTGLGPLRVEFADQSTGGATSWAWDFDANGTVDSTLRNPSHVYWSPGTFGVRLTVSNTSGSHSKLLTSYVIVQPGPAAGPSDAVLVGAGDIAVCGSNDDEATANLLDAIPGTVITIGDNAYEGGTATEFADCYEPSWGRHKARTRPAIGNHEYQTPAATGYFGYFGSAAGDPAKGYYSYDVGTWHVIVLNSECAEVGGCDAGSPQETWLRQDLAANPSQCTLAYWHRPRWSSSSVGGSTNYSAFWTALQDHGADVVLAGHAHVYERFAPQLPSGVTSPSGGIRQFTVGTGGKGLHSLGSVLATSEVLRNDTFGVLKLDLRASGYQWEFVPVAGSTFRDAGSDFCH